MVKPSYKNSNWGNKLNKRKEFDVYSGSGNQVEISAKWNRDRKRRTPGDLSNWGGQTEQVFFSLIIVNTVEYIISSIKDTLLLLITTLFAIDVYILLYKTLLYIYILRV